MPENQKFTNEEIQEMIKIIYEFGIGLDEWETYFIVDMYNKSPYYKFSEKQAEIIDRIYSSKTQ